MKNIFSKYVAIWSIAVAAFFAITFAVFYNTDRITDSFWVGYSFIVVMFIGQLICAYISFNTNNASKVFYNIPLSKLSFIWLAISIIAGAICMGVLTVNVVISVILCVSILALSIYSILVAKTVIDYVEEYDNKIKTQTFFIKSLTIDAETLMERAKDDAVKAECRKVAEALRYSDPMSNEALASAESAITLKFASLQSAVQLNDKEKAIPTAQELVVLINDRNRKCKLLK